jgi:hypothetical protein
MAGNKNDVCATHPRPLPWPTTSFADCVVSSTQGTDDNTGDGDRGRGKLVPPLSLPKNRSTGNLALSADATVDRSRYRMSFEGPSSSAMEYDALARLELIV